MDAILTFGNWHWIALVGLILLGLFMLWKGADWLTDGAASLALKYNINPLFVGLTILSIATSMPEFITVLVSALGGNPDVGMGNIVGSNICNIGLILGAAALIYPLSVQTRLLRQELPFLLLVTLLFSFLALNNLNRWEGLLLILIFALYLTYTIWQAKQEVSSGTADATVEDVTHNFNPISSLRHCLFALIGGAIVLSLGANWLVESSVEMAHRLSVSPTLIGITVVAIGTSLPELAASIAAAAKKQGDLCTGNIIGSNIFNLLFVGGGAASLLPLKVDPKLFRIEIPAMLIITAILFFFLYTKRKVTPCEGVLLLAGYTLIIALSTASQFGKLGF